MGLDQTGEPVYRITEKCKDVFPEFYSMYQEEINQTTNELWQLGVVEIMFNTDTSVNVKFTSNNYLKYREVSHLLTEEQKLVLEAVVGSSLSDLDHRLL